MYEELQTWAEKSKIVAKQYGLELNVLFNSPARDTEIAECEDELNVILPDDYKSFIRKHNGLFITYEADSWPSHELIDEYCFGLYIYSIKGLLTNHRIQKELTGENWGNDIVLFAFLPSSGDYCGINLKSVQPQSSIVGCYIDEAVEDWRHNQIADTFSQWLELAFINIIEKHESAAYWYDINSPLSQEKALYEELSLTDRVSSISRISLLNHKKIQIRSSKRSEPRELSSLTKTWEDIIIVKD